MNFREVFRLCKIVCVQLVRLATVRKLWHPHLVISSNQAVVKMLNMSGDRLALRLFRMQSLRSFSHIILARRGFSNLAKRGCRTSSGSRWSGKVGAGITDQTRLPGVRTYREC